MGHFCVKQGFRSVSWEVFTTELFIFNVLIALSEDIKTPIDFGFTRSKVKVAMVTCKKTMYR